MIGRVCIIGLGFGCSLVQALCRCMEAVRAGDGEQVHALFVRARARHVRYAHDTGV